MATLETVRSIAGRLREQKSILVATHISPDADAVGSSIGLVRALQSLGIKAHAHLPEGIPSRFQNFVDGIVVHQNAPAKGEFDALVSVDSATKQRIGPFHEALYAAVKHTFNVDHHVSNDGFAEFNLIDSSASSSAEIVLQIVKELGVKLTPEISTLLYMGLADDTGHFRYSNVTAETFQRAAELVNGGARPSEIAKLLSFSQPLSVLRLRALALNAMKLAPGNRIAWITVPLSMLQSAGARPEDTEGIIDEARSVTGVDVALLLRELEAGKWKASLRSKIDSFDANVVCGTFGGGGHKAASGATLYGTQAEVEARMLDAIGKALH